MVSKATSSILKHQSNVDRPPETLEQCRRRRAQLLRMQHYEPVISEILSEELPKYTNSSVIDSTDTETHMRECALILASAPKFFLTAVEGNLVSGILNDADLQAEYATIQQRAHHQPSIYIHVLADAEGTAPTPNQYLIIRNLVQDYLKEDYVEYAHNIDNITTPAVPFAATKDGYRKYLHTTSSTHSPTRIATLHRFCAGITTRHLSTPPSQHNTPFPHPPSECGYALHAHKRLAQHRAHRSSNYIMNLVSDICTYLFHANVLTQHFTMHQFIIYLIFRPEQAAIAEILCSGLLQCWVDGGGGFNAYPAGRSVGSAGRVGNGEWEGHGVWVKENSGLLGVMGEVRGRAEVWRRAVEWEGGGDVDMGGEGGEEGGMHVG